MFYIQKTVCVDSYINSLQTKSSWANAYDCN